MRTRRATTAVATMLSPIALVAGLTACDVGDGTELRDPAADAPPPTDVPVGTVTPVTGELIDGTLDITPIETPTPTLAPDAPTLPAPADPSGFTLAAPWDDGTPIDPRYGCDGANAAPPLAWSDLPAGTAELAISLVDESDLSRGRPFVHWVMTGIDPSRPGLAENEIPPGAVLSLNFFGDVAYTGPCPDPGTTGVYRLTLSALNQQLEIADATPAADTLDAIAQVVIDERAVTGSSTR